MADLVLPIGRAASGGIEPVATADLKSALPVLSLGVKSGPSMEKSIGYIKQLKRTHRRKTEAILQLEPYSGEVIPSTRGSVGGFNTVDYWPGERVEVVPGVIDTEQVDLDRTVMYTSTLFESVMRLNAAGDKNISNAQLVNNITNRYANLLQQLRPVMVYEIYASPIDGTVLWGIKYIDCWFTNMERTVKTDDTVIVESSTLEVTRTRLIV